MTTIYLIRHCEADGNVYRRFQSRYNSNVTKRGEVQCELVAERLRGEKIDAIYSSDIYRARRTAAPLAREKGLPVILEPGLREIDSGEWEDLPWGNVRGDYPETYARWQTQPWRFAPAGGETFDEVGARMHAALARLAAAHEGQTIAAFSHGAAMRCFLYPLLGLRHETLGRLAVVANTAVTKLTCAHGAFSVEYAFDASHLPGGTPEAVDARWWCAEEGGVPYDVTIRSGAAALADACAAFPAFVPEADVQLSVGYYAGAPVGLTAVRTENGRCALRALMVRCMPAQAENVRGQMLGQALAMAYGSGAQLLVCTPGADSALAAFLRGAGFDALADARGGEMLLKRLHAPACRLADIVR